VVFLKGSGLGFRISFFEGFGFKVPDIFF